MIAKQLNSVEQPEWTILRNRVMRARANKTSQSKDRKHVWSGAMRFGDLHVPVAPELPIDQLMPADDYRKFRRFVQVAIDRNLTSNPPLRAGGIVFTVRIEPTEDGGVNTFWTAQ